MGRPRNALPFRGPTGERRRQDPGWGGIWARNSLAQAQTGAGASGSVLGRDDSAHTGAKLLLDVGRTRPPAAVELSLVFDN